MSKPVRSRAAAVTTSATDSDGGSWSEAAAFAVACGGTALADPTASSRLALAILLSHLTVQDRLLASTRTAECSLAGSVAAHRASSLRLRRMLLILLRYHGRRRRVGSFDEATLRRSIGRQLTAHVEIEQDMLAVFERIHPDQARDLAATYERLMAETLADPGSVIARRGWAERLRRTAVLGATRRPRPPLHRISTSRSWHAQR